MQILDCVTTAAGTRAKVELLGRGEQLSVHDARILVRARRIYAVLVPLTIMVAIRLAPLIPIPSYAAFLVPVVFVAAALDEARAGHCVWWWAGSLGCGLSVFSCVWSLTWFNVI